MRNTARGNFDKLRGAIDYAANGVHLLPMISGWQ
jgi:hypothetical protein